MLDERSLMRVLQFCNRELIMASGVHEVEDGVPTKWWSEGLIG